MESKIFLQEDICARISKNYANFKKTPKDRLTLDFIETKVEQLEQLWSQYRDNHKELITSSDLKLLKSTPYIKEDFYSNAEDIYEEYKCLLKSKISKFSKVSSEANNSIEDKSRRNVKLPTLTIPTFNGKYTEWTTFKDLFVNHVHKADIPDIEKLQYLKGFLSGEPEQMVRNIPIADGNYKRFWDLLDEFYSNKRYLSHQILKRLCNQKKVGTGVGTGLRDLIQTTSECLGALSNLGVDVSTWDLMVIHMLSPKLDTESRQAWELNITQVETDELPTLQQFYKFVKGRFRAWEVLDSEHNEKKQPIHSNNNKFNKVKSFLVSENNNIKKCKYCNEDHFTSRCKKFTELSLGDRRSFVEKQNLCFNCLGANHSVKQCRIKIACHTCGRKHHTLLHLSSSSSNVSRDGGEGSSTSDEPTTAAAVVCFSSENKIGGHILLATALVRAETKSGGSHIVRALLDQGSQASFVTEATAQYLGLKKIAARGLISGLGESKNICSKYVSDMTLTSLHDNTKTLKVRVHILPRITNVLPSRRFVEKDLVGDLPLADPHFNVPNKIDILLGAEVFYQIIEDEVRKQSGIVAQKTSLGWVLSGIASKVKSENVVVMHTAIDHEEENDLLRKFWEIEAEPNHNKKHILTEEELRCEEFFATTTTRDKDGRYVVRLPFNTEEPEMKIKNSKKLAEKRLKSLKAKLDKASDLKGKYKGVLEEYLTLNHMEKIPVEEVSKEKSVYLPHFAVLRDEKETTKVRIVFDASCKGEYGVSLNGLMMVGPTLQPELRHLLMRWRSYKICLSADIVKMYRQIKVAAEDVDCQRILWQEAENEIEEFRLLRVTFGTASAPYLAVKALQQVAIDDGDNYPMAAERIKKDFYMDDLLSGCENVEDGIRIFKELNELLGKAGFTHSN